MAWLMMGLAIFSAGLLPVAQAADDKKDSRQRESQRRAQQAIKQAQARNAELEQANTELAGKLREKEQSAGEAMSGLEKSARKNRQLVEDLARAQSRTADLETRLKETERNLEQARTESEAKSAFQRETELQLKAQSSEATRLGETLAICAGKNEQLYQLGRELINHVEKPEGLTRLWRTEPFTQIGRVELEKLFQNARDDLDQNHMPPARFPRKDYQ
jgi:chromosome segregation ATPase